jgi:S-adenosyl methyltransferase
VGEPGVDEPRLARIRDYWLGGSHHTEFDRKFADNVAVCAPHIPHLVRAQRALLGRMVRYLVGEGVRQFLDLGSGLPTMGHLHEVAFDLDPDCRVVYVDNDPAVVDDGRQVLARRHHAVMLDEDLRRPDRVLGSETVRALLDLDQPVAVIVIATLQHIPDSDDPIGLVASYREALASGSFLAISHLGPDEQLAHGFELFDTMLLGKRPEVSQRQHDDVLALFEGLELVPPGVVPIVSWRPDSDDDEGPHPERYKVFAGLGRKP